MPLPIQIEAKRGWDYQKEQFIYVDSQEVILEHCLLAVARWESKWKKSFFKDANKRPIHEMISYIQCMVMNDADENFIVALTPEQQKEIINYISEEQTATTITHNNNKPARSNEILTSELIYYYMSQVPLPFDICERWHLSRLLKTLEIASIKSQPEKKMNPKAWGSKQSALNAMRRAKLHSKG